MSFLANLRPKFWEQKHDPQMPRSYLFNFRRIWKWTIIMTLLVALVPLTVLAIIDYRIGNEAMESEILLRTTRLVSNTRRRMTYFFDERKSALYYVLYTNPYNLFQPARLDSILKNLKKSFGGFVDIGVITDQGVQLGYSGPYNLRGKNYLETNWFQEVSLNGYYISDVFMGYRNVPHMVIAIKHSIPGGGFYVLRATLDTSRFNDLLSGLNIGGDGDAFVINTQGILQTPSRNHGAVMEKIGIPVPAYSAHSRVLQDSNSVSEQLVVGYANIAATSFILMIVKNKELLMEPWYQSRRELAGFFLISVLMIVLVILGGITYLVNQIYQADQRRVMSLHKVEYANKMASLGRLSAGIAHEINNPLAIIREKAGLVKDLFMFTDRYDQDPKLLGLVDVIILSVDRCADITWRLLGFARNSHKKLGPIELQSIIQDVLGFMGKEAEYRSLTVTIDISPDVPKFVCDQGHLQEIFLNIITNAFSAVQDGGHLKISATREKHDWVNITFSDDGRGINEQDIEHVFEPFYSTRLSDGGSGLGLYITFGLVHDLGGRIGVKSILERGTTFLVLLPLVYDPKGNNDVYNHKTEKIFKKIMNEFNHGLLRGTHENSPGR